MELTIVNIKDLAEFIIRHCEITQNSISNLKLQKLLYYIQAWHLVFFEKHPLFNDEPEAWVNGPVYREVYNQYKPYGYAEISLGFENSIEDSYQEVLNKLNLSNSSLVFHDAILPKHKACR